LNKTAIIFGAGPAGLTAALELLEKTKITPIIFEISGDIGGISKTFNFKGNRIDIGGHRFFSKSDQVMDFWKKIMPIETSEKKISDDKKMLIRKRLSRIFWNKNFFDYPISLSKKTIRQLGLAKIAKIGTSYFWRKFFPIRPEKNLEDFFKNRFGTELFRTFFEKYTEKVWGRKCHQISAEWGSQRIKGISISKILKNAAGKIFKKNNNDISQKNVETSLIENFLYPKFGPGQMWEEVAKKIEKKGGKIEKFSEISEIFLDKSEQKIEKVLVKNKKNNQKKEISGDYFFSTIPVKELFEIWNGKLPKEIEKISSGLEYRDFMTVGVLSKKMKMKIPDNWIYTQDPEVVVGRLQFFKNWSPFLVADRKNFWIGMEYFCNENEKIWNWSDQKMIDFGVSELEKLGMIEKKDVIDAVILRTKKAYPAYFGSYDKFPKIQNFLEKFENLFLIGRNGMHRYNNMDHSMLSAMEAVKNIISKKKSKKNIWSINAEKEYHEKK